MNPITITQIDIYAISLDFVTPFRIALGSATRGEGLAIRIQTDAGLHGVGEASPYGFITGETQAIGMASAAILARLLVGKNPLEIEARLAEINAALTHNPTIKSAFDMALYDLAAKCANLPLYALLGGQPRPIFTDFTIGIVDPASMAEKAVHYVAEGASSLKIKLGTTPKDDVRRMQAIREAIGMDLPVRIDANQGWDATTAIATLQALSGYRIDFCEEPVACWNNAALKRVHDHSPIPIMADESVFDHHDAFRLASLQACDYFNIKLAKSGGIHTGYKINAIGEAAGIACMVGGMFETRVGISAAAHLFSACSNIRFADLDTIHHYAEDPVLGGAVFAGSQVVLPETPGHGADFDPAFLKKMEKISIR